MSSWRCWCCCRFFRVFVAPGVSALLVGVYGVVFFAVAVVVVSLVGGVVVAVAVLVVNFFVV